MDAPKKQTAFRASLKAAGLSQVELARRVGVDRGVIGRIVRGQQLPTSEQAAWIATALGQATEDLFPDANFRGGSDQAARETELAERVLGLETKAADLLAENEMLKQQQQEILEQFSRKLSQLHDQRAELQLALEDKDSEVAAANERNTQLNLKLWQTRLQSSQREQAFLQRVDALERQVKGLRALAAAGGGAAIVAAFGALSSLGDR